jgi:YD repeat-containing protein
MITPSGGRSEIRQVGSSGVYESADGSFNQLTFSGSTPVVRTTDGTQYIFGTALSGEWRCTQIEDRNGNYVYASYDTSNGHIQSITDTLGRVINFGYDGDGNLYNITQTWGGRPIGGRVSLWTGYMSYVSGLSLRQQTIVTRQVLANVTLPTTLLQLRLQLVRTGFTTRHKAPDGHELEHAIYDIDTSAGQTDCPKFSDRRDMLSVERRR